MASLLIPTIKLIKFYGLLGRSGDADSSLDYRIGSREGNEEKESCSAISEISFLAEAVSMIRPVLRSVSGITL